ncbi:MAG: hypothetical protein ABIJ09_04985 [Pseudomonadota bacterium]
MRPLTLATRGLCLALLLADCNKDQQPGSFEVVFDWSATSAPTAAEFPELWVRGRVERRDGTDRAAWTVVAEAAPAAYGFSGDTQLAFSAVPNEARALLVVVLEIAALQERASPATFYGESEPFAIQPEQQVEVKVRMQTRRVPHVPAGTDPTGALSIVEAAAQDGLVGSPEVTLSFVAEGASQVLVANDLSFSLHRSQRAITELSRDGEHYLWRSWNLDTGLCSQPPCADGTRRVYLKLLNDEGYASPVLSTQATVDTTPPRVTHSVATPHLLKLDGQVALQLTLDEPLKAGASPTANAFTAGSASLDLGQAQVSSDRLTLSWVYRAAAGADGEYALRVTGLCDRVNNCHGSALTEDVDGQALCPFSVDATAPIIEVLTTPSPRYSAHSGYDLVQVRLRADQAPQRYELWVDDERISDSCASSTSDPREIACSYQVVDDGTTPGGTRVVYATIWDAAGNSDGADAPIVLDFEPPVLLSPVVSPGVANATSAVAVSFSFSEPVTATTVHWDGLGFSGGATGLDFTYTLPPGSAGGDGSHSFTVSTRDLVGNALVDVAVGDLHVDATLPGPVPGSISVSPTSVHLGDTFTLAFTIDEELSQEPVVLVAGLAVNSCTRVGLDVTCTHQPAAGDLDGFKDLTVSLVDLAENHATHHLGAVEYDSTPPAVIGASLLREPFFAPARDGQRTWFSATDPFTDSPVTARLYVFASERLNNSLVNGRPVLSVTGPGNASLPFVLDAVDEALAIFSYTFDPNPAVPYVDGAYQFTVTWADLARNATTRVLPVTMMLVAAAPGLGVDVDHTVYRRIPWGAEESSGVPRFSLSGNVGVSSSAVHVLAFRDTQARSGDQIGMGDVDAGSGDFTIPDLSGGDVDRVYAVAVHRSGARGPVQGIRDVEWVATLGRKLAGSTASNPHRFENLVEFPPMLYAASNATTSEVGGAAAGVGSPGWAQVAGDAGWTRVRAPDTEGQAQPSPRQDHAMAYDVARGRSVLFGGTTAAGDVDETWEWDGHLWHLLDPATKPRPRHAHSMVYDEARARVVMYGGKTTSTDWAETWEWDGHDWLQRFPAHDPCWRRFAAMAYDASRRRVVLYGGFSDEQGRCGLPGQPDRNDDTWEWDGQDWDRVQPVDTPGPRESHTMAFDASSKKIVLFGGNDLTDGCYSSETWLWDGANWSLATTTGPSARWGATAVHDGAQSQLLLFGGYASTSASHYGNFDDTWAWTGTAWTPADGARRPEARHGHTAVYDAARQQVFLFGGNTGRELPTGPVQRSNSTWLRDPRGWRQIRPEISPDPRIDLAMAYDAVSQKTLLYGGSTSSSSCDRTTWLWDGETWHALATAVSPTACHQHALAHDVSRGRTVLYGGAHFSGVISYPDEDTWEWDGSQWSKPSALGHPRSLRQSALVYDGLRDRSVLYGGHFSCTQSETWEWRFDALNCFPSDEACWTRLSNTGGPTSCQLFAMAYDEGRDRVVLNGGTDAASACLDETWEFGEWGVPTCAVAGEPCWGLLSPAQQPPALQYHAMVYDPGRQQTLLFGGGQCANPLVYTDETWEWNGTTWTPTTVVEKPARRQRHAMSYDPVRGKVVLFGGNAGSGRDAETWEFDHDQVQPAQVFRVDLAAMRLDATATVTGLDVLLRSGARGEVAGSAQPGAELHAWQGDHWVSLDSNSAPLATPADLPWSPTDISVVERMRVRDTLHFAVTPRGPNGTGLAQVRTDYAELRLRYRLP